VPRVKSLGSLGSLHAVADCGFDQRAARCDASEMRVVARRPSEWCEHRDVPCLIANLGTARERERLEAGEEARELKSSAAEQRKGE
jgi:hypothetical protein